MTPDELIKNAKLAKNGDKSAFCKLYELYYKDMYKYALYCLNSPEDAEDIISQTVLDAFVGIKKLKKPESIKSYFFTILTTKIKRQQAVYVSNRNNLTDDTPLETMSEEQNDVPLSMDVENAIKVLDDKERMVITLTVFTGYNSSEVADIMQSTPGTVRSLKSRALEKLKGKLSP